MFPAEPNSCSHKHLTTGVKFLPTPLHVAPIASPQPRHAVFTPFLCPFASNPAFWRLSPFSEISRPENFLGDLMIFSIPGMDGTQNCMSRPPTTTLPPCFRVRAWTGAPAPPRGRTGTFDMLGGDRAGSSRTFNVKGHYNQTFTIFNVNGTKRAYFVQNRGNRLPVVRQTWLTEDNGYCAKRV